MLLLVGLGNPGAKYAAHRHNVGFMAIDAIVRRYGFHGPRNKFQGALFDGRIGDVKCLALEPQTYMNAAGRSVAEATRFYKLDPAEIVVFYDEIDLAPGKVRVKTGGGSAGHNGTRSISAHIGPDFRRVRIGIGHPGHKDLVHGHVLQDFSTSERQWLEPLLDALGEAAPLLVQGDDSQFMSRVALLTQPGDEELNGDER